MKSEATPSRAPGVRLRPVTSADGDFLLEVFSSVRADEMALVPWSEEQREAFLRMQFDAQQTHYRAHNPGAQHDIILVDENAVGRLYVARRADEIRILDITILPEQRGKGTGTSLLRELMSEAARAGKPLTIYVENFNRSQSLFQRLGFKVVKEDGFNNLMEWRAC